ncbi:electron transfer flavoprotein subunit alpha [Bacillota bacterium]
MKKIWVYAEETQGEINKVTLELLTKARELGRACSGDAEIAAVLLTEKIGNKAEILQAFGASTVYAGEDVRLASYCHTSYAPVLAELIKKEDPDIFLFGATQTGSELAPTVAAIVKTGVAAHCVDLRIGKDGLLVSDVPAFGGKIIGEILIPACRPQMASVKPGTFIGEKCEGIKSITKAIDLSSLENADKRLRPIGTYITKPASKPIDEAEIVLAGGYGLGTKENWSRLEELAELLGGAAGSTRPCLDEGWADSEETMIGTSGKSIRPKVYMGFGISGATHHLCGIKDSGLVISINKDPNANIFGASDYCAVCDVDKMLPVLIDLVKAAKVKGTAKGE